MKIGVAGASGYLGAELLRLLAGHPVLEVAVAQGDSSAGTAIAQLYPNLAPAYGDLAFSSLDPAGLDGLDAVFVALPSGRSQELVRDARGRRTARRRPRRRLPASRRVALPGVVRL